MNFKGQWPTIKIIQKKNYRFFLHESFVWNKLALEIAGYNTPIRKVNLVAENIKSIITVSCLQFFSNFLLKPIIIIGSYLKSGVKSKICCCSDYKFLISLGLLNLSSYIMVSYKLRGNLSTVLLLFVFSRLVT